MSATIFGALVVGVVGGIAGAAIFKENPFKVGVICAVGWFLIFGLASLL